MRHIHDRGGFTLIEVIVVAAIISIMAGIMIPFVYKVWDSNAIELTRERMSDLKKAMVGDNRLIQNGARTHYGFIGECGQLPGTVTHPDFPGQTALSNDLLNPGGMIWSPNCVSKKPYMAPGFDPNTYDKDAWGKTFEYTPSLASDGSGRRASALLKSAGPDGILGTSDDITDMTDPDVQISEKEVFPTNAVQGNLNFVFYNSTAGPIVPDYRAVVTASYMGVTGPSSTSSSCIPVSTGQINANESKAVSQSFIDTLPVNLQIGKVLFKSTLYPGNACAGPSIDSANQTAVFVGEGLSAVSVNLPTINYSIP
jgi:prepilin-type N-terminal cleavage/methylation domain-containing protein